MPMTLAERAAFFNRIVLDDARDEHGLIRHQLTHPNRQPITADMVTHQRAEAERRKQAGQLWHPHQGTAAYAMYEDANYVANRYLMAQVWRWLATHDEVARRDAGVGYQATMYPYHEGRKIEPGYWPKPYEALVGEYAIEKTYTATSLDQAYSPVMALWRFHQHMADDTQKAEIAAALHDHAHWWIRHDYAYNHLGVAQRVYRGRIGSPSVALKIPIGLHMAWQLTGDTQLRDEVVRIIRQAGRDGGLALHRGPRGEIKDLYHWAEMADYFRRETELAAEADWEGLIRACWRAAKSTIQPDGLCLRMGYFNDDGLVEAYTPGPTDDVAHGYWQTDARDPGSTAQMACLAMLVHELGYDGGAGEVGRQLLERVDETLMAGASWQPHWMIYTHPEQIAPWFRAHPPPSFFSTRLVVFWLDGYWRGRRLGLL